MNDIENIQSNDTNVNIAAAFRFAYRKAKFWKLLIWCLTLFLAIGQLIVSINHQSLQSYMPDNLAAMVISISLVTMMMAILGKHYFINKNIILGSNIQRLHDFNVLGLGIKPTHLEVLPSLIEHFSNKWLTKHPNDRSNLSGWWPVSVSRLPIYAGITLCLLSTFRWEYELRKTYSHVLLLITLLLLSGSLYLMHVSEFFLTDYIVLIFLPISPLLGLLIDEWLQNRTGVHIAKSSSEDILKIWNDISTGIMDERNAREKQEQLLYLWGSYRASMSPIFDKLYWLTQKVMNEDMIINTDSLITEYHQNIDT
jgi:hypothetical protein